MATSDRDPRKDADDTTETTRTRFGTKVPRGPGKSGPHRQSDGAGKSGRAGRMKKPAYRMMIKRMRNRLKDRKKAAAKTS
jgi:hypothetical protein